MDTIWLILAKLRDEERDARRKQHGTWGDVVSKRILWCAVVLGVAIGVVYVLTRFGVMSRQNGYVAALALLLGVYLLVFLSQMAMIIPALGRLRKPSDMLFDNIKVYASVDMARLEDLADQGEVVLRQARHALSTEITRLRGSVGLLVGKVGSIGLLPGLVAAVLLIEKVVHIEQAADPHLGGFGVIMLAVAAANPVLFVLAVSMQPLLWQFERFGRLLDLAIDTCETRVSP